MPISTLATDLDGTLIPVDSSPQQLASVRKLKQHVDEFGLRLVFVTGRSLELALDAIHDFDLPEPDHILCNVGSTTADLSSNGTYSENSAYQAVIAERQQGWTNERIRVSLLEMIPCLSPQPDSKQTDFKCSFDFAADYFSSVRSVVEDWIETMRLPLTPIISVDPETDNGLLDILPAGINKGFALRWWAGQSNLPLDSIVFCGDSGNDSAAMAIGVRGVLVGNADEQVREETEQNADGSGRIYFANGVGPQGVFEGLLHHQGQTRFSQST